MPFDDDARKWTDAELDALEKRMAKEYRQAANEMRKKQENWLAKFAREREQREKALDSTQEAMDAYNRWLQSQTIRETWFKDMVDGLTESAHRANERAADMLNDHIPKVYAENANRAAFAVDKAIQADTRFTLVNEDAVRYLMGDMEQGQLIHEVTLTPEQQRVRDGLQSMRRDIDAAKDVRWNRQKFTSAITQGILQGESIQNIVKRTESIYGMNTTAAIRAARTSTTSAENAGRMSSFERAQRLGIDMEIEWLATLDLRTRDWHRALDGERIKLGEKFSNGLRWPGDPSGPGEELWNCRCRADGRVVGFDGKRGKWADEAGERWSRLPKGMTYDEWKASKAKSVAELKDDEGRWKYEADRVSGDWYADTATEAAQIAYSNGFTGVAEGQDILGTWQRRPDQYDFEIEDVMAAQGFDGKPRIVDADEFDRAVNDANGGDGLIMQRVYSAPDQAKLDTYRDMLYDGKWYVDCSTGGAEYGQGMYCAGDWSKSLSDRTVESMRHYASLYEGPSYIETMTLDSSAMVVKTTDLAREAAKARSSIIDSIADEVVGKNLDAAGMGEMGGAERDYLTNLAAGKRPSANINPERYGMSTKDMDEFGEYLRGLTNERASFDARITRLEGMDEGVLATALGYDAIDVSGQGYIVVLNRTKLIIRRP